MSNRLKFYDLPEHQQQAIREYELRQVFRILTTDDSMTSEIAIEFITRALNKYNRESRLWWKDEIGHQMKKLTTKQQHLAYLYLKGTGINKISKYAKIHQETITDFIASPTFNMFPASYNQLWINTPLVEKAHDDLVSRYIIVQPNICGGF